MVLLYGIIFGERQRQMTNYPNIKLAMELYCKETAGDKSAYKIWNDIPLETRQHYLERVSPRAQAIEVLARWRNPFCALTLKRAELAIEALELAGLVISQKEEE